MSKNRLSKVLVAIQIMHCVKNVCDVLKRLTLSDAGIIALQLGTDGGDES